MLFSSIANLKCTTSDRKIYPWGYMYTRLGTPALEQVFVTILSLVQFLQGVDGFESKTLALFA